MTGRYAEGTSVSVSKSRDEIERLLARYGADGFGYASDARQATILFDAHGRRVKFVIPMPDPNDRDITHTSRGRRAPSAIQQALEQETRRRWRAMLLAIKAKLEVVASGIATFEEEFATHTLLPDGSTVADWVMPQIDAAYETGQMPSMHALGSGT